MTDEFETMTVPELKELLREKGLKVGGKKIRANSETF